MSRNMSDEIKTLGFVLRRTNYGEADRILNLITPQGKISAIAKGVRKPKSKLAGGVEMFSKIELCIHLGRGELGIVTSARMLRYYSKILADYERMEVAAWILKRVSIIADSSDSPEYFKIVEQVLFELDNGTNVSLVESWAILNLKKATGEEINVYRDTDGEKLSPDERYSWDAMEMAFSKNAAGDFSADEIKMLRLMLSAELRVVKRVKDFEKIVPTIRSLTKTLK